MMHRRALLSAGVAFAALGLFNRTGEAGEKDGTMTTDTIDFHKLSDADWRKRLENARKEEAVYREVIDKLQLELNDTSGGFYNPGRASKIAFQDENKQKLAEVQGRISALEEEGRRNRYR